MLVKENFLEQEYFNTLQELVLGDDFPWYYSDGVNFKGSDNAPYFQFQHTLFTKNRENSAHYQLLEPLLSALNIKAVCRAKFNLITRTNEIVEHGLHTDMADNTTAILYFNTNNGYTKFETGESITSEANKLLEFSSNLKHTGSSCTYKKIRVVLNLNYYTYG